MSQANNTSISVENKHLNLRERYRIEILLKEKFKPLKIAQSMKRGIRTIEREIAVGKVMLQNSDLTYRSEYCADAGQRIYDEKAKNKGPGLKIGKDHKLVHGVKF